jgi:hypothetical protein
MVPADKLELFINIKARRADMIIKEKKRTANPEGVTSNPQIINCELAGSFDFLNIANDWFMVPVEKLELFISIKARRADMIIKEEKNELQTPEG